MSVEITSCEKYNSKIFGENQTHNPVILALILTAGP